MVTVEMLFLDEEGLSMTEENRLLSQQIQLIEVEETWMQTS